jgi:hypothetical protein
MDVRDIVFWASTAKLKSVARMMSAYNATLLPYQSAATIRMVMDELSVEAMGEEAAEKAETADLENADLIARAKERKREARLRRKAGGKRPPDNRKVGRKIRRIK